MGVLAIGLNDIGLCAARSDGGSLLAVDDGADLSPGYAWRRDGEVVTGVSAARHASLHPRAVDNRFWDLCDTGPLDPKDPQSPNRAEIACAHLDRVSQAARPGEDDVVIAVPPFYEKTQLGIVVAMAGELGLPLRALVPSPLAIAPEPGANGSMLIVELSLHRCMLTVVGGDDGDDGVSLRRTRPVLGVGLDVLRRRWIRAIGDAFVRATRFDPLHDAATEQRLHDDLPAVLDALKASGGHEVELASASGTHRVSVTDRMLGDAGHELTARIGADIQTEIASGDIVAIRLDHDLARVPGLSALLASQVAVPVSVFAPGAPALGLARGWPDQFEAAAASGVAFHTSRKSGKS